MRVKLGSEKLLCKHVLVFMYCVLASYRKWAKAQGERGMGNVGKSR